MRTFLIGIAVAAISWGHATVVLAQFYQQRPSKAAATPDVRRIVVTESKSPPQASTPSKPSEPPRSASEPKEPRYHHHHHDHPGHWHGGAAWGLAPWVVWGGGYPAVWTGAFTPGFGVYDPRLLPANPAAAAPAAGPLVVDPPRPAAEENEKPDIKPTNADTKARAGKFIGYGDALFAKQNYLAATSRYRTAAGVAPDMSEPLMRQGFALVALGSYSSAAKAFRRGLSIRPDWSGSPFRLRDLYGPAALAKTAHLEALAAAVEANAFDPDLVMVLAIELYFDGQRERSAVFFERAAQLGGNEDRLLNAFLAPAPAGDKAANAPPAVINNKGPEKVVF